VPAVIAEDHIERCVELFEHGDVNRLLGELSPPAEWLPVLIERRVFDDSKVLPGEWIGNKVNDPAMIKACAGAFAFDDQCRWQINQGLQREKDALTPTRERAWRILLAAKRPREKSFIDDSWYSAVRKIKDGDADFETRKLVQRILRPQLKIEKPLDRAWYGERDPSTPEALSDLLRLEFEPADHPPAREILAAWPEDGRT
jgi:hypothetical protein